jgi:hypothetical protein
VWCGALSSVMRSTEQCDVEHWAVWCGALSSVMRSTEQCDAEHWAVWCGAGLFCPDPRSDPTFQMVQICPLWQEKCFPWNILLVFSLTMLILIKIIYCRGSWSGVCEIIIREWLCINPGDCMYEIRQMIILKYSQLIANHRCVHYIISYCIYILYSS